MLTVFKSDNISYTVSFRFELVPIKMEVSSCGESILHNGYIISLYFYFIFLFNNYLFYSLLKFPIIF